MPHFSAQPDVADHDPDPVGALPRGLAQLQGHHAAVRPAGHLGGVRIGEGDLGVGPAELAPGEGLGDRGDVEAPGLLPLVDRTLQLTFANQDRPRTGCAQEADLDGSWLIVTGSIRNELMLQLAGWCRKSRTARLGDGRR